MTRDAILSWEEFCGQDVCSSRHKGNEESAAAFEKASLSIRDDHRTILGIFDRNGGMTSKEIAQALGRPLHSVSGRLTELKAGMYLEKTSMRRDGSAVLRRTRKEWR